MEGKTFATLIRRLKYSSTKVLADCMCHKAILRCSGRRFEYDCAGIASIAGRCKPWLILNIRSHSGRHKVRD